MPFPLEHFYSPYPATADIRKFDFEKLLSTDEIPAIDLNLQGQLELLENFDTFYHELPFTDTKSGNLRYYYKNGAYSYPDAIFLYCMLRHLSPNKIIEVGSGFSSCVTLDTNELFLKQKMNCVFIEPYPVLLKSLLKDTDMKSVRIFENSLQEIPLELFKELSENDILFIDSTHVSKFDSDVNYIIHTILPNLAKGVYIHFHDIGYPFEYPKSTLEQGYAWNESYILRAFLEYNNVFSIVLYTYYLKTKHAEILKNKCPLLFNDFGGSIWIKKCR
jgi:hypothetical protein